MIVKNFINNFNIYFITLFSIYIYIINLFFLSNNIRHKFFLFFINFFIIIGLGFFYNLDGLVLIFFVCEFTVLLVFILLFSQIYTYSKQINSKNMSIFFIIILLFNIFFYNLSILNYKNFYSFNNIVQNDFFYIYNLYFEKQILITIIVLIIITVYSIFFILMYNNLKLLQKLDKKINTKITLLRKQNIIHQNNYITKIRVFKDK